MIVAVTSAILLTSVLAAILVGMHLFTEAHTQLIKVIKPVQLEIHLFSRFHNRHRNFERQLHLHIAHTQAITDYNQVGSMSILCDHVIKCSPCLMIFFFQDSMRLNSNTIQETILDPERNIIQYHVTNPEVDAMIVEDFNKVCQLIETISST